MINKLSVAVLSSLAVFAASQASAQVVSPTGNFTVSGNITMSQSAVRTCVVTLDIAMGSGSSNSGKVTAATFATGDTGCGSIIKPRSLPWDVTRIANDRIDLTNVAADTLLGYCDSGTVQVAWTDPVTTGNPNGKGAASTPVPMPGTQLIPFKAYPTATCTMSGTVFVTTGGPVSVN